MKMSKITTSVVMIVNLLIFPGCEVEFILDDNKDEFENNIRIEPFGSGKSFDIATWNIEHFPKNQDFTIPYLFRIISDIDIDLIAIQEIDDKNLFMGLVDSLDGYQGFVSQLPAYGQRLGIIYKSEIISISDPKQIFVSDDWAFPRPPLITYVVIKDNYKTVFDFILIILHLKAFNDKESEDRRREACQKLEKYISTYLLTGTEKDILIVGDFNDKLDDPVEENIFKVFLDDSSNYEGLTLPIKDIPTYIGNFESSVDHIFISGDARNEYQGGYIQVLKIDETFSNYVNYVSDHRPVLARFFIF
jgi:endonuclease/exonuclease/phosphatase family metal-dependent hydrolase